MHCFQPTAAHSSSLVAPLARQTVSTSRAPAEPCTKPSARRLMLGFGVLGFSPVGAGFLFVFVLVVVVFGLGVFFSAGLVSPVSDDSAVSAIAITSLSMEFAFLLTD